MGAGVGSIVGGALGTWGGGEVGQWIGGALYRTFGGDSEESESRAAPVGDIGSAVQRSVGTSDTPSASFAAPAAASPVVPTSENWTFLRRSASASPAMSATPSNWPTICCRGCVGC